MIQTCPMLGKAREDVGLALPTRVRVDKAIDDNIEQSMELRYIKILCQGFTAPSPLRLLCLRISAICYLIARAEAESAQIQSRLCVQAPVLEGERRSGGGSSAVRRRILNCAAQVFELGPVESICVDEGSNGGENEKMHTDVLGKMLDSSVSIQPLVKSIQELASAAKLVEAEIKVRLVIVADKNLMLKYLESALHAFQGQFGAAFCNKLHCHVVDVKNRLKPLDLLLQVSVPVIL
ncbi:hypothetical protein Sjap_006658 [Stephania japonica]|uniref:Uncharacterized protein n=1 Tax=Stephania japonica TaxID=461633 RepID=A0AAP0PM61_9MAGN